MRTVVTYIGDGSDTRPLESWGCVFPVGEAVQADLPDLVVTKLRGNRHFIVHDEPKAQREPTLLERAEAIGIKVDGRWSDKRILAEIEKAKA